MSRRIENVVFSIVAISHRTMHATGSPRKCQMLMHALYEWKSKYSKPAICLWLEILENNHNNIRRNCGDFSKQIEFFPSCWNIHRLLSRWSCANSQDGNAMCLACEVTENIGRTHSQFHVYNIHAVVYVYIPNEFYIKCIFYIH